MHERFDPAFSAQSGYFDQFLGNVCFVTPFFEELSTFSRATLPPQNHPPPSSLSAQTKAGPNQHLTCPYELLGRSIFPVNTPIAIPRPSPQGLELHVRSFVNYLRMNPNMFPF